MCAPIEVSAPVAESPRHELVSFGADNSRALWGTPGLVRMGRWTRQRPARFSLRTGAALLVAAGLGPPGEHALVSLLALNGLRVSEATAPTLRPWAWSAAIVLW